MNRLMLVLALLVPMLGLSCKTTDTGGGKPPKPPKTGSRFEPGSDYSYPVGRDTDYQDGSIKWSPIGKTVVLKKTIVIQNGETFDGRLPNGKLTQYVADPKTMGTGDQREGQEPLFEIRNGGTLRNVVIGGLGKSGADGVHIKGEDYIATLERVEWRNTGEDAVTCRGNGDVRLKWCKFAFASDKTVQVNTFYSGEVTALQCQWYRTQKAMRSGNRPKARQTLNIRGGSGRNLDYVVLANGKNVRGKIRNFRAYDVRRDFVREDNGAEIDED